MLTKYRDWARFQSVDHGLPDVHQVTQEEIQLCRELEFDIPTDTSEVIQGPRQSRSVWEGVRGCQQGGRHDVINHEQCFTGINDKENHIW